MADLPPRPADLPPPPRPSRRDDRPYPLRASYDPRYDRRDDVYRRDYDSRDRSYDRDRDYDRRMSWDRPLDRPPPHWDDRRLPYDRNYDRDRDRDRYDRRGPPPRYVYDRDRSRERNRSRERYHDSRYDRYSPRRDSPPRSPPRHSFYRPRSRSRSPLRRPPPPSPPRMQARRRTPSPRRSPSSRRSRSPPRRSLKLGTHSISSPVSARSPPRHPSPSRRSPYRASSRSRDGRSPFSDRGRHDRSYSSPRRSDRGSEISARHEGLSPVSPNPEPEIMTKAHTDQRSQTPALPSVENKEVIDSQRHEDVAIKHEHEPAMDAPFDPPLSRGSQTPSYHPPQQDGKEDKSMPDAEGDIVMKSEPEPPPSISMPVPLPTKPRGNSSPPRQPRWHDTRGGHPPTQPRHHWQRGRGAPFRGFPYDPPRAPRNHPIAASGMSQASPVQTATPNLPTPAPAPDGAAVTNDPFANIPEPIIPDYKSLLKLSPETETKVQELDALRKQIALQQKHAFNLTLEFGNIHKTTRRALHEFEMSTFDLRAAMARRKSTATQLELARAGMLGIDFEGDFSREGSTES